MTQDIIGVGAMLVRARLMDGLPARQRWWERAAYCNGRIITILLGALVMLCSNFAAATPSRFADQDVQGIVSRVSFNGFIYFKDIERPYRLVYIRPNATILRKLIHGKLLKCRTIRIREHTEEEVRPISCQAFSVLCDWVIDTPCNSTRPVWEVLPFKWRTLEGYMVDQGFAKYLCEPSKRTQKRCR